MPKSNGLLFLLFVILISSPKCPVLGEQSFNRPDPLQHLKPYHGDFDVRNRHYWASAVFTGIHGYAMAGVWILGGLGFGIFVVVKNLTGGHSHEIADRSKDNSPFSFFTFLLVVLFTFLAIAVSGMALAANKNFYSRAKKMKQTILGTTGDARKTIHKVTRAMNQMHRLLCPYDEDTCFRSQTSSEELQNDSETIRRIAQKNCHTIDMALKISYGATAAIVSINLVLVVASIVLLLLHWKPGFITIIFICWILTALCWVLSGFHFFLYTVIEDACAAFAELSSSGSPHKSSLESILPCFTVSSANHIMVEIGYGIHSFITKLNTKLMALSAVLGVDEQQQDGGLVQICDPFSNAPDYKYEPSRCPKHTISISDVPNILDRITCSGRYNSSKCEGGGSKFISKASIKMARAYSWSIQGLLDVFPDIQSLTHCSFLKDTFSNVVAYQCRPMKISIHLVWTSMLALSICMVALELVWIVKAYQNRGRCMSLRILDPCIK